MNLALFDLDNTLLAGDSDFEWAQFLISKGVVDREIQEAKNIEFYDHYKAGTLDIAAYIRFTTAAIRRHGPGASAEAQALYAPSVGLDPRVQSHLQALREAVHSRHMVQIDYADVHGRPSLRRLRPLGCFYWGKVWTLSAWCELRNDFRGFRIDRIAAFKVLPERFRQEPGKTLADLLRQVEAERDGWPLECVAAPGADGRS